MQTFLSFMHDHQLIINWVLLIVSIINLIFSSKHLRKAKLYYRMTDNLLKESIALDSFRTEKLCKDDPISAQLIALGCMIKNGSLVIKKDEKCNQPK